MTIIAAHVRLLPQLDLRSAPLLSRIDPKPTVDFDRCRPTSATFGRTSTQICSNPLPIRPKFGQLRSKRPDIGRKWPRAVGVGPIAAEVGPSSVESRVKVVGRCVEIAQLRCKSVRPLLAQTTEDPPKKDPDSIPDQRQVDPKSKPKFAPEWAPATALGCEDLIGMRPPSWAMATALAVRRCRGLTRSVCSSRMGCDNAMGCGDIMDCAAKDRRPP